MDITRWVLCPLCGLPLSEDLVERHPYSEYPDITASVYDEDLLPSDKIEWLGRFRVLSARNDELPIDPEAQYDGSIPVSNPGYWEEWSVVSINGSNQTWPIYNINADEGVTVDERSVLQDGKSLANGVSFYAPAHDVCIEIAHRLARWRKQNAGDVVIDNRPNSLMQIYLGIFQRKLTTFQHSRGTSLNWDNDFYGARKRWSPTWWSCRGEEWLVTNPLATPDITTFILGKLETLGEREPSEGEIKTGTVMVSNKSLLESLPGPAITRITDHLDLESILVLRRCSLRMYNLVALTKSLWKDRFLQNETVPWLWDLDVEVLAKADLSNDWRGLAVYLMDIKRLYDDELPLGIRNRIRIWKIISEIRF